MLALQVHHVHLVVAHLRFQRGRELRAIGFQHRDVVLDRHGVVDLTTHALGRDAHADALARRVHSRGGTGRATTDDQHVVGVLGVELGGFALTRLRVELGDDLFHTHAAGGEHLAVQEHHGHGHDLALGHFLLEGTAFDHHRLDLRVDDVHERQRLHHVRAVVAGQGHVDLEAEVTVQRLDRIDHVLLDLGRVAARPQQRQHQRGELVAQRQASETHTAGFACTGDYERRLAGVVARGVQRDLVRQAGDDLQQRAHVNASLAVVQRRDQRDRLTQHAQVLLQLGLEGVVKHGELLKRKKRCGRPLVHGPANKPMGQRNCQKKQRSEVTRSRTPRNRLCRAAGVAPLRG